MRSPFKSIPESISKHAAWLDTKWDGENKRTAEPYEVTFP